MHDSALPPSGAERYALALEAINEAVYDYDATNGTIYYAPQLGAMLGLGDERLRTVEDWTSRIHPDDLPSYRQAWRALFRGEQARLDCQYRYRAGDGKWRWAHQHGIALRDGTGRVQRVVGATGDVTELRDAQELQAATAEVLRAISRADFDLETVLQTLVGTVAQLTRADAAILWRYRDGAYHFAAGHLINPAFESIERATPIRPGEETVVGRAALRQSTVHIVDAWTDPDYGPKQEARMGGVRSMLAVPLVREGVPIGMFSVGRHAVDPFTPQQISLIDSFADQAVIAIENARLIAELQQRTAELEEALEYQGATSEILRVINASPSNPAPVFDAVLEKATHLCEAGAGLLWLYDGDVFRAAALRNVPSGLRRVCDTGAGEAGRRDDAGPGRQGSARPLARRYTDGARVSRARTAHRRGRGAWRLPQHDLDPARQGRRGARRDVAVSAGSQAVFREAPRSDGGVRGAGGHRARERSAVRGEPAARGRA